MANLIHETDRSRAATRVQATFSHEYAPMHGLDVPIGYSVRWLELARPTIHSLLGNNPVAGQRLQYPIVLNSG
jgi:hypothetical protein